MKIKTYANNRIPTQAEIDAIRTMNIDQIKEQHLLWFHCLNCYATELIWTTSQLHHARNSIAKQNRRNEWLYPIYKRLPKTDMIRTERYKILLALCLRQHELAQ